MKINVKYDGFKSILPKEDFLLVQSVCDAPALIIAIHAFVGSPRHYSVDGTNGLHITPTTKKPEENFDGRSPLRETRRRFCDLADKKAKKVARIKSDEIEDLKVLATSAASALAARKPYWVIDEELGMGYREMKSAPIMTKSSLDIGEREDFKPKNGRWNFKNKEEVCLGAWVFIVVMEVCEMGCHILSCSAYIASPSSEKTWTMCTTFPEYVAALATIVGSIFGGVGIACLPLGLILSFIRRPKAVITHSQYIKEATELGKKAKDLKKEAESLRQEEKAGSKEDVKLIEEMYPQGEKAEATWALTVLGYLAKLFLEILRLIVSVAWVGHIIICLLVDPPLCPFLNEVFIKLDDIWGLLGTAAFAFFCFYLLLAVIAGAMVLGLRLKRIDVLLREKEDTSKENQQLSWKLDEIKQGKMSTPDTTGEQAKKEEKNTRIQAIVNFVTMQFQLCTIFFTFSLGTRTRYFGRTILHGGARYQATDRGFVVRDIKFSENYRLYSRSHFVKG
ncbi:hypothetical protein V8G54_021735 [Vigna mungo]|uniref:Glycosyl transferase 48 domain-containing protein n=1 Tax=Vigna mungo TaxID=3915 RepID=A0AAQ3RXM6_VIGMU